MLAAGLGAIVQGNFPPLLADRRSPVGVGLRSLFDGRSRVDLSGLSDRTQEQTLLAILAVAIWAAVLPWLAGGEALVSGVLSLIAMVFPVLYLLTAPSGRLRGSRDNQGEDVR